MGAKYIARKIRERGGPIVGGPEWDIRLWAEQAMTTSRPIYLNSALSIALAQPLKANAGWQYLTTAQVTPATVLIDLESTVDIRVGDVFQLVDGVNVAVLTVKVITSATRIEVLAAPGGAYTYTVGSTAGDPDNLGDLAFWLDDGLDDPWISVTKVGSAVPSIPRQLHTKVAATTWEEEGVVVATRSIANHVGARVTVTDVGGKIQIAIPNPMTTAGDVIYGGVAGAETRLAIGTAGAGLKVNAGATAPEWSSSAMADEDLVKKWALIG